MTESHAEKKWRASTLNEYMSTKYFNLSAPRVTGSETPLLTLSLLIEASAPSLCQMHRATHNRRHAVRHQLL